MRVRAAIHQMQRVRVLIAIVQSAFNRAEQQRAAGAVRCSFGHDRIDVDAAIQDPPKRIPHRTDGDAGYLLADNVFTCG